MPLTKIYLEVISLSTQDLKELPSILSTQEIYILTEKQLCLGQVPNICGIKFRYIAPDEDKIWQGVNEPELGYIKVSLNQLKKIC